MSWVKQARRDFLPDLQIRNEVVAYVKFLKEPETWDKGEKTNLKGEKVKDIRVHADVEYLGGSARARKGKEDSFPSVVGEKYTLWIGGTLGGKLLELLNFKGGDVAPPLVGTMWKIWRSEKTQGGNRLYDAELLKKSPTTEEVVLAVKTLAIPKTTDEDVVKLIATDAIKKLDTIDRATWLKYLIDKGAGTEAKALDITMKLQTEGVLTISETQVALKK
jgi:hypothetical protein